MDVKANRRYKAAFSHFSLSKLDTAAKDEYLFSFLSNEESYVF